MTSKEQRIIRVLNKRINVIQKCLHRPKLPEEKRFYLTGKLDGYTQALELLTTSEESIAVELENG